MIQRIRLAVDESAACLPTPPSPLVFGPIVQDGRIEIRSVVPHQRPELRVEAHGSEHGRILQRPVKFAPQNRLEVDDALGAIREDNAQSAVAEVIKPNDMVEWMRHAVGHVTLPT